MRCSIRVVGMVLVIVGVASCSDANLRKLRDDLYAQDNKLTLLGDFCATSPSELSFPTKVLFVVDNSHSLNVTDPDHFPNGTPKPGPDYECEDCWNQRQRAIREIWERYENRDQYHFSLILFPSGNNTNDPATPTDGFVQGSGEGYIHQIANPQGLTPMRQGLEEAKRQIEVDIIQTDANERNRLQYIVILFSDGFPQQYDSSAAVNQDPEDIKQVARDIKELENTWNLGGIAINSAFLRGDDDQNNDLIDEAAALMLQIAQIGRGDYREFVSGSPDGISFRAFDFSSFIRTFRLKTLQVTNMNAIARRDGTLAADTDGDGISDEREIELGLDPLLADTDGDYCSDVVELIIGTDPLLYGDCECEEDKRTDSDGDGLLDCEEILLGTKELSFDSDLDGLLDGVEIKAGTSPLALDHLLDNDLDGVTNRDEILQNTLPNTSDPANRPTLAYTYDITEGGLTPDGRQCYSFEVSNISLVQTMTGLDDREGVNNICVHVVEASQEASLGDAGILRTGCFEVQYFGNGERFPPGNILEISLEDETRFTRYE